MVHHIEKDYFARGSRMIAYLIIFLSIALVIGSWLWLMPSPMEKQVARIRQGAIAAGFHPKFISHNNYRDLVGNQNFKKQNPVEKQIVRYSWHGNDPDRQESHRLLVLSDERQVLDYFLDGKQVSSESSREQEIIGACLEQIPSTMQGVLALESLKNKGKHNLSIYWQEQGELTKVDFSLPEFEQLKKIF